MQQHQQLEQQQLLLLRARPPGTQAPAPAPRLRPGCAPGHARKPPLTIPSKPCASASATMSLSALAVGSGVFVRSRATGKGGGAWMPTTNRQLWGLRGQRLAGAPAGRAGWPPDPNPDRQEPTRVPTGQQQQHAACVPALRPQAGLGAAAYLQLLHTPRHNHHSPWRALPVAA